jgi:hypothetical protein
MEREKKAIVIRATVLRTALGYCVTNFPPRPTVGVQQGQYLTNERMGK